MNRLRLALLLCRHPRLPGRVASFLRSISYLSAALSLVMSLGLFFGSLMGAHTGRLGDGVRDGALPLALAAIALTLAAALSNLWFCERLLPTVDPKRAKEARLHLAISPAFGAALCAFILFACAGGPGSSSSSALLFCWVGISCALYTCLTSGTLKSGVARALDPAGGAPFLDTAQRMSLARIERQRLLIASSGSPAARALSRARSL